VTPFLFPVAKDFALLFFDRYVSTEPTGSQSGRKSVSRWADQDLIGICQCGWGALVAAYEDSVSRTITSETRRDIKAERRGKDLLRSIGTEFEDRVAAGTGRLVELPVL
jgi:hypothetical protein